MLLINRHKMFKKWIDNRKRDKRIEQTTREIEGVCISCGDPLGNNQKALDKKKCAFCSEPKRGTYRSGEYD